MSFIKKLDDFLNSAVSQGVVDFDTRQKLQNFAQNYEKKSFLTLLNLIGLFGGLAVGLGIILVISHNWKLIADSVKISVYLALLAGLHLGGYLLRESYPKISRIIYVIIAIYILAGIGLVAQIFHLSSSSGMAYLMWFILILPMALMLRNSWIGVLSLLGFYIWLHINVGLKFYEIDNSQPQIIYFTALFSSMILLPRTFVRMGESFSHAKYIGCILLAGLTLLLGFSHEFPSRAAAISLHPLTLGLIIFNTICITINFTKFARNQFWRTLEFLIAILLITPLLANYNILCSVIYWIIWFFGAILLIQKGENEKNKLLINSGIWCVIIGLIARFVDLVDSMLFTGSMFIFFGIILILIAYIGEKFRKKLINKIFKL